MRKLEVWAAIGLLAAVPAWAERSVNESRPLSPTGRVEVSNIEGSVKVIGWGSAEVEITGTLGPDVEELEITGDESELRIEVKVPDHEKRLETDLVLRVPVGAGIEVETVSATIEVEGLTGTVDLESVSGWVKTSGRPAELSIETVSGDLTVAESAPRTDLASVSGSITVELATGRLEAESVSGAIRVAEGSLENASFETVSGDISYAGDIVGRGSYEIDSMSGSVTVLVPPSVSAEFDISTFSGSIDNDIGPQARGTSKYTPEKELSFSTGSGGARVSIESFSGSIKIKAR
jgi:DUF4097 and DUF4098 domain-containing protein YvlB